MRFYFRVHVSNYWEDPPDIETYEHSLEDDGDYASESLQCMMDREGWLEQIPFPARLPDHDFLIIGIGKLTSTKDYWGEYDTDLDLEDIKYRSWPTSKEKDENESYLRR